LLDETVSNSQRERESLTRQLSTARDEAERLRTLEADLAAARRDGEALTLEVRRLAANDEQLSASVRGGQERLRELEMELEAAKASEEEAQARINSGVAPRKDPIYYIFNLSHTPTRFTHTHTHTHTHILPGPLDLIFD